MEVFGLKLSQEEKWCILNQHLCILRLFSRVLYHPKSDPAKPFAMGNLTKITAQSSKWYADTTLP